MTLAPSALLPRARRRLAAMAATALAAGLLLGIAGAAQPASAHDQLLGSTPEPGEVFEAAPEQVELTFSDNVIVVGTVIEVVDEQGSAIDTGETEVLGPDVLATLPADLEGEYQVRWRVVSSDGHPIEGTIDFGVGAGATGVWDGRAAGGDASDAATDPASEDAGEATDAPNGWLIAGFVVGALAVIGLVIALIVKTGRRAPGTDAPGTDATRPGDGTEPRA
ncbi:copper resistance CopC family protein [Agromyces sp. LHK192]|uniref:copper resistance CopC family protein n=1 Tax=Agromyces sp. LHK192 TaxID=2498704 RepID=UPI000FDA19BE|nr:copper resistance CopC family protein [Agromyces sp. LHK192]